MAVSPTRLPRSNGQTPAGTWTTSPGSASVVALRCHFERRAGHWSAGTYRWGNASMATRSIPARAASAGPAGYGGWGTPASKAEAVHAGL